MNKSLYFGQHVDGTTHPMEVVAVPHGETRRFNAYHEDGAQPAEPPAASAQDWCDYFEFWRNDVENDVRHDVDWDDHVAECCFEAGFRAAMNELAQGMTDFQLESLFDAAHEHGEFGREFREHARRILSRDGIGWIVRHDAAKAISALAATPEHNAAVAPAQAKRVYLVATGETHEVRETYTRHADAPPPLCDYECLYAAEAEGA